MSPRHDNDHRHCLLVRLEVVEDEIGVAGERPTCGQIVAAVQEIQHRVARGAALMVIRRSVYEDLSLRRHPEQPTDAR